MKHTDVLIVGAGPAGSVCGYLLKKAGIDCLLMDQATFPRDKICGGGLTPKAWHLLKRLIPELHYDFNPVTQIRLFIDETCCDFTLSDPLRIVHRKTFDYALLKAYQDIGGEFMKGSFSQVEEHDGYLTVTLRSGEQVSCRYLVGADGSNSQVRRYLKPDTERGYLVFEQYIDQNGDNTIDIHPMEKAIITVSQA